MENGFQTRGISYWEHGTMVAERFKDLISSKQEMQWALPSWFTEHRDLILDLLTPFIDQILIYQQWHDCGKPYCRTVDADGKVHYPDTTAWCPV